MVTKTFLRFWIVSISILIAAFLGYGLSIWFALDNQSAARNHFTANYHPIVATLVGKPIMVPDGTWNNKITWTLDNKKQTTILNEGGNPGEPNWDEGTLYSAWATNSGQLNTVGPKGIGVAPGWQALWGTAWIVIIFVFGVVIDALVDEDLYPYLQKRKDRKLLEQVGKKTVKYKKPTAHDLMTDPIYAEAMAEIKKSESDHWSSLGMDPPDYAKKDVK